ncbi:MAG: PAS domain-containing protein [Pseudomonadota bacterium]
MLQRIAHPNTKIMLDAWKRMGAPADPATDSNPIGTGETDLLANLFLIRQTPESSWVFSSAGDGVSRQLGRALVDHDFLSLWTGPDRQMIEGLLGTIVQGNAPALARARGETLAGNRLEVELALAPLPPDRSGAGRLLGLYQSLGGEGLLAGRPIWTHRLVGIWPPERPPSRPRLRLVAQSS